MSRPRNNCIAQKPPRVKGFNPIGYYANQQEPVILCLEEYESIRLLDYEGLNQTEAAELMHVSRPTLTRIYFRARKKMAIALTEARQISIEGGTAIYNEEWHECSNCLSHFNNPNMKTIDCCPLCGSYQVKNVSRKI